MSENITQHSGLDEDEDSIFVNGALLDLESIDSAIDALAHDEAVQAEAASDRSEALARQNEMHVGQIHSRFI